MRSGPGMMVWQTEKCGGGNPERFAQMAAELGLAHVAFKVVDGGKRRMGDLKFVERAAPLLQERGIETVLWGFYYASGDPWTAAELAIGVCRSFHVRHFVVNAEKHFQPWYKEGEKLVRGHPERARPLADCFRRAAGEDIGVWLSTFADPRKHQDFPYDAFLGGNRIAGFMPQCYGSRPIEQARTARKFADRLGLALCPTIRAYKGDGIADVQRIVGGIYKWAAAKAKPDIAAKSWNYWSWQHAERLPAVWEAIQAADSGEKADSQMNISTDSRKPKPGPDSITGDINVPPVPDPRTN